MITIMMTLEGQERPLYRHTNQTSVRKCDADIQKFIDDKQGFIINSGYCYNVFLITASKMNDLNITDEDMAAFEILIKQSKNINHAPKKQTSN